MALIQIKNIQFSYPDCEHPTLNKVSFEVSPGEFLVIGGPSGCGKTTLLRLLKKEIQPVGRLSGEILYRGIPLDNHDQNQLVQDIGFVFQDPENQIVMDEVWQELVFGLENIGLPTETMRRRVAEMVQFFGLEDLLQRKTYELSGGQKQIINLASALLLQPKVLLLDEPTAQLDPVSARDFLQVIKRVNEEMGITVMMAEHRLEDVLPLADRLILMEQGTIRHIGEPGQVLQQLWAVEEQGSEPFVCFIPSIPLLYLKRSSSRQSAPIPLTVKEGKRWLEQIQPVGVKHEVPNPDFPRQKPVLEAKRIDFQYDKHSPYILRDLSLQAFPGEILSILGGNGAGKSTLLHILAGALKPRNGSVLINGKKVKPGQEIGYLPQNPLLYFVHETVEQELMHTANRCRIPHPEREIDRLLHDLGIVSVRHRHPHDLSGGERQKAALAGLLLAKPRIILADEPTKGLDPFSKIQLGSLLQTLQAQGITIVMVTHDIEFAARYASRCAMLFAGSITAEGAPRIFFEGNHFYTTSINRMIRDYFPHAITHEEVLARWRHEVSL